MKKLAVNGESPLTVTEAQHRNQILAGVNAIQTAVAYGFDNHDPPPGIEHLVQGEGLGRLREEVAPCNRMTAYITFHEMGPWADIEFKHGQTVVKRLTISFVLATQRFLIVAQ